MNYHKLIILAAAGFVTAQSAPANNPSILESNDRSDNHGSELEHLPPASPSLIDQVLEEIPPEATDSFLRRPTSTLSEQKNVDLEALRQFSITLDRQGKDIQGVRKAAIIYIDRKGPQTKETTKYYPLTRPGESNFVAVVLTKTNESAILNPIQGFNYGLLDRYTVSFPGVENASQGPMYYR